MIIFVDNYFSNIALAKYLYSKNTYLKNKRKDSILHAEIEDIFFFKLN